MFHHILQRAIPCSAALILACLPQSVQAVPDNEKDQPQLRLICVSSLADEPEVVLAAKGDKGKWRELGTTELRSSFTTEWMPAAAGELHLALRNGKTLNSICRFNYPAGSRRALVVLVADPQKKDYEAHVVDPAKAGFVKGSTLIFNMSTKTCLLQLGSRETRVEAGQHVVATPKLQDNGMYSNLISYLDAKGKPVLCYDRMASGNPDSRSLLFLLPGQSDSPRVMSLPLFGSLE